MSCSFPSSVRLKERQAFDHVFEAPDQKSSDGYFTVLGRFSLGTPHSRLGLVIAKKNAKRAHERNRLKRLAREVFRLHYAAWQAKGYPALDMVVMSKMAAQQADNEALCRSLLRHFERLHRANGRKHEPNE